MRPGQRKSAGEIGQGQRPEVSFARRGPARIRVFQFVRQCRTNWFWRGGGFVRQCRTNRGRGERLIKLPEPNEIGPGKAAAKPRGEILGQFFQQRPAILRPLLTRLLKFHDAPANLPVGGRHERVDGARAGAAGGLQQLADPAHQARNRRAGGASPI